MFRRAVISIVLAGITLAVYARVASHEFVDLDDLSAIVHNENLRPATPGEAIALAFTTTITANWIPVTTLSLQIDRALYGESPAGFLLTNAALHTAASVLLYLALARLTGAHLRSAFVAAVFALHPLHVESVAWAAFRKDSLSAVFWMLCLLAHASYVERPGAARYARVVLAAALALLSKPTATTLPFALLLLDFWPLGRLADAGGRRRAVLEKVPLLVLSGAMAVVTYLVQRASGAMDQSALLPLGLRLGNAVDSYLAYLGDSFWPADLAVFYPHPMDALPRARVWLSGALLAAASGIALWTARSRPYLAVGWFWFLGTLVPTIGLVQVGMQARADRYMYIPLVGLGIAVAWGTVDLFGRGRAARRFLGAAAVASLGALATATWLQLGHWRGAVSLHRHSVAVTRDNFIEHERLANALVLRDRLEEALPHFREALRDEPRRPGPHFGLADALVRLGRSDEAIAAYQRGLRWHPEHPPGHANLGLALLRAGRIDEARRQIERALALHAAGGQPPLSSRELAVLHVALADVASRRAGAGLEGSGLGRQREAIRHLRTALDQDPGSLAAANDLAWILATSAHPSLREPAEAVRLAEAARARGAPPPALLDTLAAAYAAAGRFPEAVATAAEAERAARAARLPALVAAIRARAALYREGRGYVVPPGAPRGTLAGQTGREVADPPRAPIDPGRGGS